MKKAIAEEVVIWDCPYKKCGEENEEHGGDFGMFIYDKTTVKCRKCKREVLLVEEFY